MEGVIVISISASLQPFPSEKLTPTVRKKRAKHHHLFLAIPFSFTLLFVLLFCQRSIRKKVSFWLAKLPHVHTGRGKTLKIRVENGMPHRRKYGVKGKSSAGRKQ